MPVPRMSPRRRGGLRPVPNDAGFIKSQDVAGTGRIRMHLFLACLALQDRTRRANQLMFRVQRPRASRASASLAYKLRTDAYALKRLRQNGAEAIEIPEIMQSAPPIFSHGEHRLGCPSAIRYTRGLHF